MFNESRLLESVSYGSQFGHSYRTNILQLRSGHERRNAEWSAPLGRFSLSYDNLQADGHEAVIRAHHACMGQLIGFRFKDWADYKADMEQIGVGTGANQVVQLSKNYTFGSLSAQKKISKPVQGTIQFFAGETQIYPIASDYTTGIFTVNATAGAPIYWSGEFDIPVRFASDELLFSINDGNDSTFFLTADVDLQEIRL